MRVSILILTLNEEQNLADCLQSVSWSDDVLVLDSFSTDRTLEIARANGARVLQRRFDDFAQQRNFGLAHGGLKHDWVLHLDADEVVSEELRTEMLQAVRTTDKDAFELASRMMFFGHWLKHSGLYPWYQVRLGKKDKLSFIQVGHGQRENLSPDRIGRLKCPLTHYSFSKGLSEWVDKHNRYATAEALHFLEADRREPLDWAGLLAVASRVRWRRAMKRVFAHLPCRPTLRFVYMYLFRLGFLDGAPGYHYCRLLALYEYLIVLKIKELRRRQQGLPV